jgi:hypothetical protein
LNSTVISEKHVSSIFKAERGKFAVCLLHAGFFLGLLFNPDDADDMLPETTVEFQGATSRYISEDKTLHNHRSEYLKSYFSSSFFQLRDFQCPQREHISLTINIFLLFTIYLMY